MKYNSKYGVVWFTIILGLNAIGGILFTMTGILTLLALDTSLWYCFPIGLFCLFNVKTFFEIAQNEDIFPDSGIVTKIKEFEKFVIKNKIPLTVEILGVDDFPHIANVFKICLISDVTGEDRILLVGDEYIIRKGKLVGEISPRKLQ